MDDDLTTPAATGEKDGWFGRLGKIDPEFQQRING